jgi:hypothetical protein
MGDMLDRFLAAGVRFEALDGDRVRAIGDLTDDLRTLIRESKPAILAELREPVPFDPEAFEERAAIAEHDGGLDRPVAEALAWAEDDRRRCRGRRNLSDSGRCLAAWRSELKTGPGEGFGRNYSPITCLPRRCSCFVEAA